MKTPTTAKEYVAQYKSQFDGVHYIYTASYMAEITAMTGKDRITGWSIHDDFFKKFSKEEQLNMPLTPKVKELMDRTIERVDNSIKHNLKEAIRLIKIAESNRKLLK